MIAEFPLSSFPPPWEKDRVSEMVALWKLFNLATMLFTEEARGRRGVRNPFSLPLEIPHSSRSSG